MKICVTSIGSLSGPFVTRRLKDIGHNVIGTNIEIERTLINTNYCDDFHFLPHSNRENEYINQLLLLQKYSGFDFILPLTDPEAYLISTKSDFFSNYGVKILSSSQKSLASVRDKFNLFSQTVNLTTDQVRPIPTFKTLQEVLKLYDFPIIAKPIIGRSSQGIRLIKSLNSNESSLDNYIYQPFLNGDIITVDAIRKIEDNFFFAFQD